MPSTSFMREILEFKVGGLEYSPSRNHLDHFTEGLKSALEVLIPVTQYIKNHNRTDMVPLKDQLVSSLKSGVDMMAESLSDSELEESESEEAAKRFCESVYRLCEKFRSTTARETSPAMAHIPGAEQNQASLDVERFHAGIFRKESDLAVGSPTIKTLTQSQDLSPEGRVLLEYYSR
jgi:hypothetical protein